MNELIDIVRRALREVWLHRWIGLVAAWVFVIGGAIAVYIMPDQYEATARVYVDTQSILKPLMSGLAVQLNVDQQVAMMSRTLISRPNVERVVGMSDLGLAIQTQQQKDALVDSLSHRIQMSGTGGINLYWIALRDANPAVAKKIVQSFLTIFVESNLGDKRKDSDSAKDFLDEQIKAYEQKLTMAEAALKDFKIQNMALMHDSGTDYFQQMNNAQADLNQARLSLSEAENARDALKRQVAGEDTILLGGTEGVSQAPMEIDGRIAALKQKLDELRLHYTDQHPDMISTKRIISELEQQKKQEIAAIKNSGRNRPLTAGASPVYQQIQIQISQLDSEVASLKTRVAAYGQRVEQLKGSAVAVPQMQAQLQQLNRDYEVNRGNYQKLLASRQSAQMASDMDTKTSGVEFRVIDPPRVEPKPVAPNRMLLMTLVFMGSILGGLAIAFLTSQIKPTVSDRKMLREITGLPVLGSVAMIWTTDQVRHRRRQLTTFAAGLVGLAGAYGIWLAFFVIRANQVAAGRVF